VRSGGNSRRQKRGDNKAGGGQSYKVGLWGIRAGHKHYIHKWHIEQFPGDGEGGGPRCVDRESRKTEMRLAVLTNKKKFLKIQKLSHADVAAAATNGK